MHLLWNYILLTEDPEIRSKMLKRKNFKFRKKILFGIGIPRKISRATSCQFIFSWYKVKKFQRGQIFDFVSGEYKLKGGWEIFPRIPEITIFYQIFIYLPIFSLGYLSFLYFFYTNLFQLLFLIFFNILFNSIL